MIFTDRMKIAEGVRSKEKLGRSLKCAGLRSEAQHGVGNTCIDDVTPRLANKILASCIAAIHTSKLHDAASRISVV